ncbi:hypothetical protein H4J59_14155 [Colwellia sp. MB02u-10]|uniref:hypothetical protein n=1 Tax=Colwellia sp. MB02u-10 TaxID=2759828 RepID=UPI0015F75E9C|nr:hypothetical protein [Colwellia sp. MB02u-10]MBA6342135.1 hypothetical protein [Colwellia sp. MB02u-10]
MIIAALTAFCFAFIAIKVFKPIAIDVGLVDKPNARKHLYRHCDIIFNKWQYELLKLSTNFCDSSLTLFDFQFRLFQKSQQIQKL